MWCKKIVKEYIQMTPLTLVSHIQKYIKPNNIYLERQAYVVSLSRKIK